MSLRCYYCNSSCIHDDEVRSEKVCLACGVVLEENRMVEEVQFVDSGKTVSMLGRFVSNKISKGFCRAYGTRESREQVLQRGYNNIQKIADYLRLTVSHVESAQRVYLMALQRNFTMGRNNLHVSSACLYTICRREKTPHLLIDFADAIQASVKTLGQMFMKLLRLLHIEVCNVDPSLFMERFAAQFDFGNKLHKIAHAGIRLIQAMCRDWISTGRRPTGLCGSALLIAARYYGFEIHPHDVAHIVRISPPTLMKRLLEFKKTSVAQLTAEEFENTDLCSLPILNPPPSFAKNNKMTKPALNFDYAYNLNSLNFNEGKRLTSKNIIEDVAEDAMISSPNSSFSLSEKEAQAQNNIKNNNNNEESSAQNHNVQTLTLKDDNLQEPKHSNSELIEIDDTGNRLICNENPTSQDLVELADKLLSAICNKVNKNVKNEPDADENLKNNSSKEKRDYSILSEIIDNSFSNTTNDFNANEDRIQNNNEINNEAFLKNIFIQDIEPNKDRCDYLRKQNSEDLSDLTEDEDERDVDNREEGRYEEKIKSIKQNNKYFFLNPQQKQAKALIWDEITKDVMPVVHRKFCEKRKRQASKTLNSKTRKKYKQFSELDESPSAIKSVHMALENTNRNLANRMNDDLLIDLFNN